MLRGVLLIRGCGRAGHALVLSPRVRGADRVAIAVHRRYTRFISATSCAPSGRSVSVTLDLDRKIQILSCHFPSTSGHSCEEYQQHVTEMSELLRGRRRNLGIDAHIRMCDAETNVCGRALWLRERPPDISLAERNNATALLSDMTGRGMRFMNMFSSWWTPDHFPGGDPTPRATWHGVPFGNPASCSIDFMLAYQLTATRSTYSTTRRMSYYSDHLALLATYDLDMRLLRKDGGIRMSTGTTRKFPRGSRTNDTCRFRPSQKTSSPHPHVRSPCRAAADLPGAARRKQPCEHNPFARRPRWRKREKQIHSFDATGM